jgi:hypothetical protein
MSLDLLFRTCIEERNDGECVCNPSSSYRADSKIHPFNDLAYTYILQLFYDLHIFFGLGLFCSEHNLVRLASGRAHFRVSNFIQYLV